MGGPKKELEERSDKSGRERSIPERTGLLAEKKVADAGAVPGRNDLG